MDRTTHRTRPLRRALGATLLATAATAAASATAIAQVAPPPAVSTAEFCAAAPAESDFDDVGDQSWAPNVRCLAHAGITAGVNENQYAPAANVSRQQMASFVARMLDAAVFLEVEDGDLNGLPDYDGTNAFPDVPAESPHLENINRLADAGIALGGPGGAPASSYGPTRNVSRGQMASFVTRALEYLTGVERVAENDYFTDDEGYVHEDNINALAEAGISIGYGAGLYQPDRAVTRAQMAAYLIRPLAALEEVGVIIQLPPEDQEVSATNSTAASTDNGNGTATISFTVRDAANEGIDGLTAEDFSLVLPDQSDPNTLAQLIDVAPGTWSDFTDADVGNGVYTIVLNVEEGGTITYTDITVDGVEIDDSLTVTITGAG